jgi:hypothetical protein
MTEWVTSTLFQKMLTVVFLLALSGIPAAICQELVERAIAGGKSFKNWQEIQADCEQCEEMLGLIEKSDMCKTFHQEMLKKAREFRLGDLLLMRKMYSYELNEAVQKRIREEKELTENACKRLHQVNV